MEKINDIICIEGFGADSNCYLIDDILIDTGTGMDKEYLHQKIEDAIKDDEAKKGYSEIKCFDTARGIFTEGGPVYEGAGIQTKNHIQICIRNLNCIKGFLFLVTR